MEKILRNKIKLNKYSECSLTQNNKLIKFFVSKFDDSTNNFKWICTNQVSEISYNKNRYNGLINLQSINDVRQINNFFEVINKQLNYGDYYLIAVETYKYRLIKSFNKYSPKIRKIFFLMDFIFHRIFPKVLLTKEIYFWITNGKNRAITFTESIGRLFSCGFDVLGHYRDGYKTYILCKKLREPKYDIQPRYGIIIKLKRVGKNGKLFNVYKLRTMHPYSEYAQEYAYLNNDLEDGGKIKNDFRITQWGKVFRKYWIDELPMLINLFKGEMKLVGVRPLSQHFFSLYPDSIQQLRTKHKPGLIPPFYVDLPKTLSEIIESEKNYILSYQKRPIRTDIIYFFKAINNILFKNSRSQ